MKKKSRCAIGLAVGVALSVALASVGCAKRVQVPPRIDLSGYGTLGIARFSGPGAGDLALREFIAFVHRGQPGTPIVELRQLSSDSLRDPAALKKAAKQHGVDTMILGDLRLTEVKPKLSISNFLTKGSLEASIQGSLHASIVDGKSGATLWSSSTRASETVAHVGVEKNIVHGTLPTASVRDVETTRMQLVRRLADGVTRDFRPRIVKQR